MIFNKIEFKDIVLENSNYFISFERTGIILKKIIFISKITLAIENTILIDRLLLSYHMQECTLILNLGEKANDGQTYVNINYIKDYKITLILNTSSFDILEKVFQLPIKQIGRDNEIYSLDYKGEYVLFNISNGNKEIEFNSNVEEYFFTPFGILFLKQNSNNSYFSLVSLNDGRENWELEIFKTATLNFYKRFQSVFVALTEHSTLHAIDLELGITKWTCNKSKEFRLSFKSKTDRILVFNQKKFYLIDAASGECSQIKNIKWSEENRVFGIRHFDNDFLYFARADSIRNNTNSNKFGKISIATGEIIWEYDVFYPPSAGKNMQLGKMFFQDDGIILGEWLDYTNRENNMLFTFDPEDPENIQYRNEI